MNFSRTKLEGIYIIDTDIFSDDRGSFIKTYHESFFAEVGIKLDLKESFYSISRKNVIRGMHFQVPPHDYTKVVYVTSGEVVDVILDVRANSPTYGEYFSVKLSSENAKQVYMPQGFAHGFAVLSDSATVIYLQTAAYASEHDTGVRWDSFGLDWGIDNPIISERDRMLPLLNELDSPFYI
jgi:dTDP-4-dehydrorhamnose 3,5-epimerase